MNFLQEYYNQNIFYNLLVKFRYKNVFQIPKITSVHLNIGLKSFFLEKKKILQILTLFKLITNQKAQITKSRKNKIVLKIKKGDIVGSKIVLRRHFLYSFLTKLKLFVFPKLQNFKGIEILKKESLFSFKIKNFLYFSELENEFLIFQNIPDIDITFNTNTKTKEELYFLLNFFNFPILLRK